MFYKHRPLSAYLIEPTPKPTWRPHLRPSWKGLKTWCAQALRHNPHLLRYSLIALVAWCAGVGTIQSMPSFSVTSTNSGWQFANTGLASSTITKAKPAGVTNVARAKSLPTGPTGQLMPPGTMSPDFTYPNSYARGQCTWYVAGRRQIPSNWGNARTWYSNAIAKGWSVGTVPAIAAVAWTPNGYYGHVALVEQVSADGSQVYVSEMNYRAVGVKSYRWVPAGEFKYIY